MSIFRGPGGAGNATTDSEITLLTQLEQSASTSAANASTSATNAANSATSASTSAANAATSASQAATSASNAAGSATAAASSATSASNSASSASTSATNAANSASAASTSATNAASSASAASTSATNAANSASTATTQAGIATTQAGNAATSANAAATSASNAATSATNAANSASAASTSATNASNSASAAATSATNASNSASAAATSATNAANSATAAAASAATAANAVFSSEPVRHSVRPSLLLDFANVKALDPRITFARASSATYFDQFGVLRSAANNVARFDHNPVTGESLGLLIEEQRTNLFLRSEEFDAANWAKTNVTVTANTVVAPDGTLTADKLVATTTNAGHFTLATPAVTQGTTYTLSVYVKAGEFNFTRLFFGGGGVFAEDARSASFNLATGTVGQVPANAIARISPAGNGWYRCSITATALISADSVGFGANVQNADSSNTLSFAGDGYSGIYIWGAQLEVGAFPTSYIPTVASQVTRSADAASMTGANFSSWYNQAEGTLYSDAVTSVVPPTRAFASINDNTASNRFTSVLTDSLGPKFSALRNTSGAGLISTTSTNAANTTAVGNKMALAVANFDVALCGNGGTVATATTYLVPVVTQMQIGQQLNGAFLNGTLRKIAYYPKRLANAELQGLTQI